MSVLAKVKVDAVKVDESRRLERATSFEAGGKSYRVLPLLISEAIEYGTEAVWAHNPMYLVGDDEGRKLLDKWLAKGLRSDTGDVVTLAGITEDGWHTGDVVDCLRAIGGLRDD